MNIKVEKKWQKRWAEARVFEADPKKGKKKFFITVPYPYVSGALHIGHGRTFTMGDVYARYHRMMGENVLYPMAFHLTGTPILAISKRIAAGDKDYIKLFRQYVGLYEKDKKKIDKIMKSFKEPWNVAKYFARVISHDFKMLGYSIDWRRKFTTGDKEYNKFIEWQFKTLQSLGYITKGKFPILFCLSCDNAAGADDVKDGDQLDLSIQEFTAIKFPYEDGHLVAATFRPETVYGLTNVFVNPEEAYVKAKVDGEIWYVSFEATQKLKRQDHKVEILHKLKGKELVGGVCQSPVADREVPILPAGFVDINNATGVVYSVPAHAPYDWIALEDLKKDEAYLKKYGLNPDTVKDIKPISIISIDGYGEFPAAEICKKMKIKSQKEDDRLEEATQTIYKSEFYKGVLKKNCDKFAGKQIVSVKDEVVDWMVAKNKASVFYESATKNLKCRCGGDVVVKILDDQWFINYGDKKWKAKATKALEKIEIVPDKYRIFFENTFSWLKEKPFARKKGLGTPLPWDKEWMIESLSDSTIYMAFYTIVHHLRDAGVKPSQLKPEFFDYVFRGKGDKKKVSKNTGINGKLLDKMKAEFGYWYPVDLRHTAPAHISNHLSFYIFNHVGIFPKSKWPKTMTFNEMLIREGAKMSKSKGNIIPLVEVPPKYSADLFRLYMSTTADLSTTLDWTESNLNAAKRKFSRFIEITEKAIKVKPSKVEEPIDLWITSKFNQRISECHDAMKRYDVRTYSLNTIFGLISDVNHYMRRKGSMGVLPKMVPNWLKLASPIIPHTCEELWEKSGNKGFVSVELLPKPDKKKIDATVESQEDFIRDVISDIIEIQNIVRKKPEQINIYTTEDWKFAALKVAKKNKNNPKGLIGILMKDKKIKAQGKAAVKYASSLAKRINKLPDPINPKKEYAALKSAEKFLSEEFGCKVSVLKASESKSEKALRAEPSKPGIEVL